MVQILETGMKASHKTSAEKYAVMACLITLANIGYNLPTLSTMKVQAIDAASFRDVSGFCAHIARNNRNDVVKSKSNS